MTIGTILYPRVKELRDDGSSSTPKKMQSMLLSYVVLDYTFALPMKNSGGEN